MWLATLLALSDIRIKMNFKGRAPPSQNVAMTIASVIGPPLHKGMIDVHAHHQTMLAVIHVTDPFEYVFRRFQETLSVAALSDALEIDLIDLHLSKTR